MWLIRLKLVVVLMLEWVLSGLALGVLVASLFAGFSSSVQASPWGTLMVGALGGGVMAFLFALLDDLGHPSKGFASSIGGRLWQARRYLVALAAFSPALLSAWVNGSIRAAVDPVSYWQERAKAQESACEFWQKFVTDTADGFRVAQRKWELGILTVGEYRASAQFLKQVVDSRDECLSAASAQKREAESHLTRLQEARGR